MRLIVYVQTWLSYGGQWFVEPLVCAPVKIFYQYYYNLQSVGFN